MLFALLSVNFLHLQFLLAVFAPSSVKFYTRSKSQKLPLQKGAQGDTASITTDSNMADTSSRTDVSTDGDTDHRDLGVSS